MEQLELLSTQEQLKLADQNEAELILRDTQRLGDFIQANDWALDLWRTENSRRWFIRQNGLELIKKNALFKVGGEWFVRRANFTAAVAALLDKAQVETIASVSDDSAQVAN